MSAGSWVRGSAAYRRIRYSRLYDYYLALAHPSVARTRSADRDFYRVFFRHHGIRSVFDVGANEGEKTRTFVDLGARVVSVEPDPALVETLRVRFGRHPSVTIAATAVGAAEGSAALQRRVLSGFNTLSDKWTEQLESEGIGSIDVLQVPLTTLDGLVSRHGQPDYIKVDVEGYELEVLRGLSSAVRHVSFEANLPTFLAETVEAIDRLSAAAPGTSFNVRRNDAEGFLLPGHVSGGTVVRHLESECDQGTYEVFSSRVGA